MILLRLYFITILHFTLRSHYGNFFVRRLQEHNMSTVYWTEDVRYYTYIKI